MPKPEIVRSSFLCLQVCVPTDWTDEQAITFAEAKNPCGTTNGWSIRRAGDPDLSDDPERNPCAEHKGFVHIMLDA